MEQYNNKLIYHYTSSSGLLGILSSESLWFTDFSVLNDESEGNYIYSLVKDVLYSGEYSKEYISLVIQEINNFYSKNKYFICSFSLNGDSLPMWNYYSKSSSKLGYNIQINAFDLFTSINKIIYENDYLSLNYYDLIYDTNIQRETIKTVLDKYYILFLKNSKIEYIKEFLHSEIRLFRFIFKHPSFRHEEECRFILKVNEDYFDKHIGENDSLFKIRVVDDGIFAPYTSMKFDCKNLITQITISPIIKDSLKESSLLNLCKKHNLTKCTIKKSNIPLRY